MNTILTEQDARTILEMERICENESMGPDSRSLLQLIREQWPDLASEPRYAEIYANVL